MNTPTEENTMHDAYIGNLHIDDARLLIRNRHRMARERRRELIDDLVEHLVHKVGRQDLVDVLWRTDIRARAILYGHAPFGPWREIAAGLGLRPETNRHHVAEAVRQALGGPEAVGELLDDIERERILTLAAQLATWSNEAVREVVLEGGMSLLIRRLGAEVGFKVTIQMAWIAASVTGANDVIRHANKAEWEARMRKRAVWEAQEARTREASGAHFNEGEAVA